MLNVYTDMSVTGKDIGLAKRMWYVASGRAIKNMARNGKVEFGLPKNIKEEIAQHSPWLNHRIHSAAQALNEIYSDPVIREFIGQKGRAVNRIFSSYGATFLLRYFDTFTVTEAWTRAKIEAKENGMKESDAGYWKWINRKASRYVRRTQPSYDPISSSKVQRSKSIAYKTLFFLGSQPLKMYSTFVRGLNITNQMVNNVGQFKDISTKKKLKIWNRTVAGPFINMFVAQPFILSMMDEMYRWARGADDEEKDMFEMIRDAFLGSYKYIAPIFPIIGKVITAGIGEATRAYDANDNIKKAFKDEGLRKVDQSVLAQMPMSILDVLIYLPKVLDGSMEWDDYWKKAKRALYSCGAPAGIMDAVEIGKTTIDRATGER